MERVFDKDFVEVEGDEKDQAPSGAVRDLTEDEKNEFTSGYEQVTPVQPQRMTEKENPREKLTNRLVDLLVRRLHAKTGREATPQDRADFRQIYMGWKEEQLQQAIDKLSKDLSVH